MYIAMLAANIFKVDLQNASKWMYYFLLDADIASNTLSWKWVAGELTGKKYFANQENINHYCRKQQQNTFLDVKYEEIISLDLSMTIKNVDTFSPITLLPNQSDELDTTAKNVLIYNLYNLDAEWKKDFEGERILLLEPSHFTKYPVCARTIEFAIAQAQIIQDIKIFVGEFETLSSKFSDAIFYFKSHSLYKNYAGESEPYERIFKEVNDYYPSFSAYWKRCQKYL
jgi:deoxyribodipyrimidine photo-lyase